MSERICHCRTHAGPNPLPDAQFGRDQRCPDGRSRICIACRRRTSRKSKRRQEKAHVEPAGRLKRLCYEPGCFNAPQHRGTVYCRVHRRRDGSGRELARMVARGDPPDTLHALAVKILAKGWW